VVHFILARTFSRGGSFENLFNACNAADMAHCRGAAAIVPCGYTYGKRIPTQELYARVFARAYFYQLIETAKNILLLSIAQASAKRREIDHKYFF